MPTPPTTPSPRLIVEAIVAVEAPREFRLHPRDRVVAYTAEAAGTRQLFTLVAAWRLSDPAHRLREAGLRSAVVARRPPARVRPRRGDLGRRSRRLAARSVSSREPGRRPRAALVARRPPDRVPVAPARLDARCGSSMRRCRAAAARPTSRSRRARPPLTDPAIDVDAFEWSPDGARIAVMTSGRRPTTEAAQISIVEVATGDESRRGRRRQLTMSVRAGCPTARSSTSPTPTAGSRSSA